MRRDDIFNNEHMIQLNKIEQNSTRQNRIEPKL